MIDHPRPRVLIVDDEEPQMKALCETLKDNGYETVGFTSTAAALTALRQSKFQLLLSDLMMPEMDGNAFLKSALQIDPDLVGIIMTGQGTIDTAVETMKTGALDYILKPFKLSVILPVLSRALATRRLRLQNADLQRRIRERTAQLEAANTELDAFASSIAHDLHAPARHISGFVQILEETCYSKLDETEQKYFERIASAAKRMGQLIGDLLTFSRLAQSEMNQRPIDLQRIVMDVRQELEPETMARTIRWKISSLPTVHGDESMLRQVFNNILSNSIKYTRDRDPAEIEVGTQTDGEAEVIYVRDNGAGFDMQFADKLFNVFQRLHSQDEFEGTGIGLANVRRIIERHGGRIWAEGEVGKGATFYFALPNNSSSELVGDEGLEPPTNCV